MASLRFAVTFLFSACALVTLRPVVSQSSKDLTCINEFPTKSLCKFVDPLFIPQVIDTAAHRSIKLGAFNVKRKLHRDLPATPVYAYGPSVGSASVPGPTLLARVGVTIRVTWTNNITDDAHMLPVDKTLMWANPKNGGVPTVTHLHGAQVHSTSDGHLDAWTTYKGETGITFHSHVSTYPNVQAPGTLWYHDHVVGITRLNVIAGLAGTYLLKESAEKERLKGLPKGQQDVLLLLQDKTFKKDGSIYFPSVGDNPKIHPVWDPEYFGDHVLVNGKVWPFFNVEPRKYRFRLINGANARFFTLALHTVAKPTGSILPFWQIGTDGGYLERPLSQSQLTIAPGERAEIVVDFSRLAMGTQILLSNSANAPYPGGDPPSVDTSQVLKFIVKKRLSGGKDTSRVPSFLHSIPQPDVTKAVNYKSGRMITLTELEDMTSGNPVHGLIEGLHWTDPVTVKPRYGTTEVWHIINLTDDVHPIHVHFTPHQVLYRQTINRTEAESGSCNLKNGSCFVRNPHISPEPSERGWKDTTRMPPRHVTTILLHFRNVDGFKLPFDPTTGPGYVMHCHILDHEDNDMMRPYVLTN